MKLCKDGPRASCTHELCRLPQRFTSTGTCASWRSGGSGAAQQSWAGAGEGARLTEPWHCQGKWEVCTNLRLPMKLPAHFTLNQQKELVVRRGVDTNPAPAQNPRGSHQASWALRLLWEQLNRTFICSASPLQCQCVVIAHYSFFWHRQWSDQSHECSPIFTI